MTQQEALKLALEALETSLYPQQKQLQAITAIREVLAQPEQKPKCGAIIEVFGKDWRLEYMSLPVGKHKLYTQQYTYTTPPEQSQVEETLRYEIDALEAKLAECRAQSQQEPVALEDVYLTIIQWDVGGGKRSRRELARRIVAKYTSPLARKPLTDEEIERFYDEYVVEQQNIVAFARAIEAAHGIKEKNT